jgi:hypothetical protein
MTKNGMRRRRRRRRKRRRRRGTIVTMRSSWVLAPMA